MGERARRGRGQLSPAATRPDLHGGSSLLGEAGGWRRSHGLVFASGSSPAEKRPGNGAGDAGRADPGDRTRCRWRFWSQERDVPRIRRHRLPGPPPRSAGALGRGSLGGPHRRDARARPEPAGAAGRKPRRADAGARDRGRRRRRCLRTLQLRAHFRHGLARDGDLQNTAGSRSWSRRGHERHADSPLSRRWPTGGGLRRRAYRRPTCPEAGHGPGGTPEAQLHPPGRLPLRDAHGFYLRQRRLSWCAGEGPGGRRLRRLARRAGAPPGGRRGRAAGHRDLQLRRRLRRHYRRIRRGGGGGRREFLGLVRHLFDRAEPRDHVRPGRRLGPGGRRREGTPRPGRYRGRAPGCRNFREPFDAGRRLSPLPGRTGGRGRGPAPDGRALRGGGRGGRLPERHPPRRGGGSDPGRAGGPDRAAACRGRVRGTDGVPLRLLRGRGRGGPRPGQRPGAALGRRRRLRGRDQSDGGGRPGLRLHSPGDRAGPLRADALRRGGTAAGTESTGLSAADAVRDAAFATGRVAHAEPEHAAGRQGGRGGGVHRHASRDCQCRSRRPGARRYTGSTDAADPRGLLDGLPRPHRIGARRTTPTGYQEGKLVKPAAFDYVAVHTPQEAVSALAENPGETRILAGGQSLVLDMNYRRERPARLVDINGVAELDRLEVSDKTLRVGALVRHRSFEEPVVTGPLGRLLSRVSHYIAHPPIRTRGTMIGSLAYAHPAAEWPAVAVAFDGEVTLSGTGGESTVPAAD